MKTELEGLKLKKLNFHLADLGDVIFLFQDEALIKFHPALSRCWKKSGWKLQYGTNNLKEKKAQIGNDVFILNYDLS